MAYRFGKPVLNLVFDVVTKEWLPEPRLRTGNDGTLDVTLFGSVPSVLKLDYVSGQSPIYLGKATPGTSTSTSSWLIAKLAYDSSGNITSILYANGSPDFTAKWDDRAGLSYS